MSSAIVVADGVTKTWNPENSTPVRAVREVSLSVAAGEALVITGPSGSGKTTLLSILGGLLRPDGGRVLVEGVDLARASEAKRATLRLRRIGFVFQRGVLLARLTARQNVALPARAAGASRRHALEWAGELLARVGVRERADLYPSALSAGEAQRVALARALVNRPVLLLADEPTAHLDSAAAALVATQLKRAAAEAGTALVVVTHDTRLAPLGSRRFRLEDGLLADAG